jgi:hypothetical protein
MSATKDPDEEEEGDRRLANIVLAVGFVVWSARASGSPTRWSRRKKADDCLASGRRNCFPIEVPQR